MHQSSPGQGWSGDRLDNDRGLPKGKSVYGLEDR